MSLCSSVPGVQSLLGLSPVAAPSPREEAAAKKPMPGKQHNEDNMRRATNRGQYAEGDTNRATQKV